MHDIGLGQKSAQPGDSVKPCAAMFADKVDQADLFLSIHSADDC